MRYLRKKADGNHAAIGKALRGVTIVTDVHTLGAIGCDYIARHVVTKQPMLIEVKDPTQPKCKRDRSENEAKMRDAYPNNWRMVMSEDEALRAIGIIIRDGKPHAVVLGDLLDFKTADLSPLARRAKRRGAP